MSITYQQAKQYVGREVCVQCKGGKSHYGIIREVNPKGLMLQPIQRNTLAAGDRQGEDIGTADGIETVQGENVFFPFFFIPFLIALSLIPLAYGSFGYGNPYNRYGYGGNRFGYGGNRYGNGKPYPGPYYQ
jgi:hypothetical protein